MPNREKNLKGAQQLRSRAEKLLRERVGEDKISRFKADAKKLLHELQVHQIELEMQNEELQEAYKTTAAALRKYTMLYDFAPMGYFTLDKTGIIIDLNFTGADLLGEKRFTLVRQNFRQFVSRETLEVFDQFLSDIFAGYQKEYCELIIANDGVPLCPAYLEGIVTGDDYQCLLSVIDISVFRKRSTE
jgi:PAS domain-containing protein